MTTPDPDAAATLRLADRMKVLARAMPPIPTGLAASGSVSGEIRAVVFDVYGTLFASGSGDVGSVQTERQEAAMRAALAQAGYAGDLDRAAALGPARYLEGIRRAHAAAAVRGVVYPEVEIREVWHHVVSGLINAAVLHRSPNDEALLILAVEYECRTNPTWPMPGLLDCLEGIRQRNLALGIVSNAQFYTPLLFHALLGRPADALGFAPSRCAWSYRTGEAKPSTALFRAVLEDVASEGIEPGECLYVGNDMLNDVWAASRTGMQTCLFAGDRRSLRLREDDPRCRGLRADAIITGLEQLGPLLDRMGG